MPFQTICMFYYRFSKYKFYRIPLSQEKMLYYAAIFFFSVSSISFSMLFISF